MKKKILLLAVLLVSIISFTGCDKKKTNDNQKKVNDSERFKEEYESLNGKETDKGKKYRELEISSNNPIVYKSAKDIVKMIDNEETFIVYFGFETCPWCRSVIPSLLQAAKDNEIDKIYYVNVKNIRDELEVKNDKVVIKTKGMDAYYELLDRLDSVLKKYELTVTIKDEDDEEKEKKYDTNEKRIYAPNIVAVVKGEPKKLTTGISEDLKDPYGKLTEEMQEDSYKQIDKVLKEIGESSGSCSMDKSKKC